MDSIQIPWLCAFYLAISVVFVLHTVSGTSSLPIERSLERSEEPNHVKIIKTQYGDSYDCVGLYKQPAFDHPSLKHHKIQESCPSGTVPIRRTTKEEQLVAKASFTRQFQGSSPGNEPPILVFAGLSTEPSQNRYTLAGAYFSTHNPRVDMQQFSASVISLEHGPVEQFATIRVGWMVNPSLYHGDNHTRLYTVWGQRNARVQHGCFNTYCPGFVQTNPKIPLDMVIENISGPEGRQLYLFLGLSLDKATGNWWFFYGDNKVGVGYWPPNLFMTLRDSADAVLWGGMVLSTSRQLPDMGSGQLGDPNGSHVRKLMVEFYKSSKSVNGSENKKFPGQLMETNCYKVGGNSYKGDYWGYSFWFGGKGGDVQKCKE